MIDKPRIRCRWGIWTCVTFKWPSFVCGCGYTPAEAYREWQAQRTA